MTANDRISLTGMRFHTRVGLLPHERQIPQPLELDLTVWLPLHGAGEAQTQVPQLDYRVLYAMVADTIGGSHHRLLEALCEKIARNALTLDGVERVAVAARKPHAPIGGPVDHVEVYLERSRGD